MSDIENYPGIEFEHYPEHLHYCTAALEQALQKHGFDRLLIHSGEPALCFLDDLYSPYVVNPHFVWWTPLGAPNCGLLLESGKKPVLYNYQPVDYWHAPPPVVESWWADHFEVLPVTDPEAWLDKVADHPHLAVIGDAPILAKGFQNAALNPTGLIHDLHVARTRKTQWEQGCLAAANHRAVRGHRAVADAFIPGVSEFELQLAYLRATGHGDNDTPYGNIIALNEHAAILHFTELGRTAPVELRSLVIDAGAQVFGYAADITRTYTTQQSGPFADLIKGVDGLQTELCEAAKAGVDYRDLHLQAHHKVAALLQDQGIVNLSPEQQVANGLSSAFLPHGLGHYLGIQVHDVAGLVDDFGEPIPRPEGHPFLRLTRELEPGNVLTIEPGIYFIEQLLAPLRDGQHATRINWKLIDELKPYGGIRIEDDVLVTDGEPRNFTREAFAA